MRLPLWTTAALAGLLVATPFAAAAAPRKDIHTSRARHLIESLARKDHAAARKHFDANLNKLVGRDALAELWRKQTEQNGELKKITDTRTGKRGEHTFVLLTCQFDRGDLDMEVNFDRDHRINGFYFGPLRKAPPYARLGSFREVELTVGAAGKWPLPGTLTLPNGDGPFPAVVLVHGSGAHDRDETIRPNKPFRDLAWGLASRGVAVLRYTKRTYQHASKIPELKGTFSVKDEVTDDALAAVALARKQKGIDPNRVFLLGHSLGGYLAPRIATADPKLAGAIILAGPSRPLEDLIEEQIPYLISLGGKPSEEDKKVLARVKEQVARIRAGKLSDDIPPSGLLGAPASYWRDLRKYDPAGLAARLKTPLLVLQGERDYQVTLTDFKLWSKALERRKNVCLKTYPALNHLFMEGKGKGKSTPAEYDQPGHVARQVVEDIAAWVKKS
jgi:dienelactone hydrolase